MHMYLGKIREEAPTLYADFSFFMYFSNVLINYYCLKKLKNQKRRYFVLLYPVPGAWHPVGGTQSMFGLPWFPLNPMPSSGKSFSVLLPTIPSLSEFSSFLCTLMQALSHGSMPHNRVDCLEVVHSTYLKCLPCTLSCVKCQREEENLGTFTVPSMACLMGWGFICSTCLQARWCRWVHGLWGLERDLSQSKGWGHSGKAQSRLIRPER